MNLIQCKNKSNPYTWYSSVYAAALFCCWDQGSLVVILSAPGLLLPLIPEDVFFLRLYVWAHCHGLQKDLRWLGCLPDCVMDKNTKSPKTLQNMQTKTKTVTIIPSHFHVCPVSAMLFSGGQLSFLLEPLITSTNKSVYPSSLHSQTRWCIPKQWIHLHV